MEHNITQRQINYMKHALGFRNDRIKGRKNLVYKAYRNYFATRRGCDGFDSLVDLESKGFMVSKPYEREDSFIFHVTNKGIEILSKITGVKISEEE